MRDWSRANVDRPASKVENSILDGFSLSQTDDTSAGQTEKKSEDQPNNQTPEPIDKSELNSVRQKLIENGIDPDKLDVPIAVREPIPSTVTPEEQSHFDNHATQVPCTINDSEAGLSRNAPVGIIRDQISARDFSEYKDQPDALKSYFRDHATAVLNAMTNTLQQNFLQPDSTLRVMSVSNGTTVVDASVTVLEKFRSDPDKYAENIKQLLGDEKGSQFIEERKKELADQSSSPGEHSEVHLQPGVCADVRKPQDKPSASDGPPESPLAKELFQKIAAQFETVMENDPQFKEAHDRYRETARQVAEKGGIIVLAVSNNGGLAEEMGANLKPGSEYSLFSMSDHVISVGGSDINGTPGDNSDDRMWENSSRGMERYPPTVVAPASIPTRQTPSGRISGTSFSAPIVANTVGLMLTQNPALGFNDVKRLLQDNAQRIPGVDSELQGAGALRIADAVLAARRTR
jgi:hypothetical protein